MTHNRAEKVTSREMLGQKDASRVRRWVQTSEISLRVSSLTKAQFDISKDAKRGHAVAAARTPASDNLIQADTSKLISRRQ